DIPIYQGDIKGELCTPTGAALLKHFATEFGKMPVMSVRAIGYGMGKKDFEAANCVRVSLGETENSGDDVIELSCNLDDMTGEAIGYASEALLEAGALDVYTTAIGMKKSRPGVMLSVICKPESKDKMVKTIFKHTSTLGIRENSFKRYTLDRSFEKIDTPYGDITLKRAYGYDTEKEKLEFDEIKKIAKDNDLSLADIIKKIKK
ncbi:MAG: LarC family nickel insertion protein, partial [Lachnospiraceae bacterium]|nr:LarC family nickel insertion protein [Lachnospiraceae bacterium]